MIASSQREEADQLFQSALQILTTHYPAEPMTADYSFRRAKFVGGRELYEQAFDRLRRACKLQGLKRRNRALLLMELADCLEQLGKEGECEEVRAFATSIAEDFNAMQAKHLTRLFRSLYL